MQPVAGVDRPDLLVSADWGVAAAKRWMCVAERCAAGYRIRSPQPVGCLTDFWARIARRAGNGSACVGFDFPLGLPVRYAQRAGIGSFRQALAQFGRDAWEDFYRVAGHPGEITPRRPFYPLRPGGTTQRQLLDGLGVSAMADLLRRCERPTAQRGAAAPLFWTLGGKQVGKAAIVGWRDLLGSGLADPALQLHLWPFDGDLAGLCRPGTIVAAETYPAEACVQLGLRPPGRGWSKRSRDDRAALAGHLTAAMRCREAVPVAGLSRQLRDGFGSAPDAEDRFDALLALLSMIDVCTGRRRAGAPHDDRVRRLEGWILGLDAATLVHHPLQQP